MKCLCGFNHSPNNTVVLKKHIEDCMVSGPLKTLTPTVIWLDGEFQVVETPSETDQIIDVDWVRPAVSAKAIEDLASAQAVKLETAVEAAETPEEVVEVVEAIIAEEETVEEAPVVEEAPKPAPKKRAPRKKATTEKPTTDQ